MNFLYPSFLFALAAVSIPVIIHLVELRRAKRILFSNLSFIREVKNVTASHRRIKQWLILLARVLFIISLVLLFSQPYIPVAKSRQSVAVQRAKIFLDNSLSMQNQAKNRNGSLLQEATSQAAQVPGFMPLNASYQLGTNTRLSYAFVSKPDYHDQVDQIRESASSRSVSAITSWLNQSEEKVPYRGFIFSDFQKSFVDEDAFRSLDSTQQYYLAPITNIKDENLFIDTVYSEDAFIRQGENNQLQVKITNIGQEDRPNCQVKFFIGDKQVSALSITVPARKTIPFALTYRLDKDELVNARLVIEDYPVTFDNTYYFTLKPSGNIRILEVAAGNMLADQLYTNENIFKYTPARTGSTNYKQIEQADLIILNGATEIDASLADNLKTFVQEGGNLVVVPPVNANRGNYGILLSTLKLTNVQLGSGQDSSQVALALPNNQNPFFRNIFNEQSRNIVLPKATKVWRWSRSANDILTFKDGERFLSAFRLGQGQVYLFASPLTNTYTNFQNHALFVPVMYKLAMLSAREQQPLAYSLGSRIFTLPFKENLLPDQVLKLRKDSVEFIPEQQARRNQLVLGVPAEAREAGFYELTQGAKVMARLAFNFDKRESDLQQYTPDELRNMIKDRPNMQVLDISDTLAMKKVLDNENLGVPLWKYCLILCLVFMLTEILLIRFF